MITRAPSFLSRQRTKLSILTLAAIGIIGLAANASANSTANTTIVNVVTVNYKDAGGLNSFAANASTIVTVNLVKAALNPSGAPTGADGNPALACLPAFDTASGSTVSAIYALTATANGQDTYNLSILGTPTNVNNVTTTYSVLDYQGLNPVAAPATRVLASAIPTAVLSANTLEFPGGALAGFAVNDIVIVQTTAGKRAFLVTAVSAGVAPVFSHVGNTPYTDATGAFTTAEVKGTLTLGAYANQTVTVNSPADTTFGGGNIAPAFTTPATAATLNVPIGEMILVKVSVTASTNSLLDGSVAYTLTTTDSATGNPATITCTVATFKAPTLSIQKDARNRTLNGSFGATATGNPGQLLEYRVTVTNTGGQGSAVIVTDAVPAYTTLVSFTGTYDTGGAGTGAATDKFARISGGAGTLDLDIQDNLASEVQPLAPAETGYGKAGGTPAASPLTFYIGDGSTNAGGGKVPSCSNGVSSTQAACTTALGTWITSYTILYQVKID